MKIQHKIIGTTIIIGIFIWIFDAVLDFLFFQEGSFLQVLIYDVHPHHLFIRLLGIGSFLFFGIAMARVMVSRKKAEKVLQEYQKAVESSQDLMAAIDRHYTYLFANKAFLEYRVMNRDQVVGHTVAEILGKETFEKIVKPKIDHCLQGETIDYEMHFTYPELKERYLHVAYYPLKAESDKVIGAVSVIKDITDRKRAEESIKMKDIAIASSMNAVAFSNLEGNLTYVNDSFLKMWGYDNESEVLGKPAVTFWQEEDKALKIIETIHDRGSWRGELAAVKKDGSLFYTQLSGHMVTDEARKPICIMVSFIDVTERMQIEEELKKYQSHLEEMVKERTVQIITANEQLTQEIIERKNIEKILKIKDSAIASSINAVGLADLEGKITYVNKSFLKMWGYDTVQEVLGKSIIQFGYHEDFIVKILESVRNKGTWRGEDLARKKDGSPFDIQVWVNMVTDENGDPVCLMATFLDITERKKSEKALRESEAKYSALVEQAKDGVFIVQDEMIRFVNSAGADSMGYTMEELIGKRFEDLLADESKELINERYALRLEGQKVPSFYETKIKGKDGTIKDVEVTLSLIQYEDKLALMGISRDVTDRKKTEEELRKVQRIESLGVLAGGIAHDFNNLLTAILGNLSLIELYEKPDSNISKILEESKKASQQARGLTQQLLTFSRGGEPVTKRVHLSALLKDTVALALSGSNVKCVLSIADDLWLTEIDEGQINQAINNIMINAEQAMPNGGIIEAFAENVVVEEKDGIPLENGKYVKIIIKDHGIGIPQEYLSKIFDPYFTTKQKGSGLGLAVTFSIVKKHGGYIKAESEIGIGTTFFIYLPAFEKELFVVEKIIEEENLFGKGRILFMDDQLNIRTMVGKMLNHLGYEAESAKDGEEAVKLYENAFRDGQVFDAVILDLTVPGGMGGKEAFKQLIKIDPKAKVIVSSGYANDPIMSEYEKYGFVGVVTKPYEIKEFAKVLHDVIEGILSNN